MNYLEVVLDARRQIRPPLPFVTCMCTVSPAIGNNGAVCASQPACTIAQKRTLSMSAACLIYHTTRIHGVLFATPLTRPGGTCIDSLKQAALVYTRQVRRGVFRSQKVSAEHVTDNCVTNCAGRDRHS